MYCGKDKTFFTLTRRRSFPQTVNEVQPATNSHFICTFIYTSKKNTFKYFKKTILITMKPIQHEPSFNAALCANDNNVIFIECRANSVIMNSVMNNDSYSLQLEYVKYKITTNSCNSPKVNQLESKMKPSENSNHQDNPTISAFRRLIFQLHK